MIELRNITASYGDTPVLKDISLAFPEGSITVILGPNGSGKSTLMRASLGLIPVTGGSVLYDGCDMQGLSLTDRARKASYLSQSRNVPSITAGRMVLHGRFPWLPWPRRYSAEDRATVRKAMERTGASDFRDRNMKDLSGGERQKVWLAMTIAQDAGTVFMDEPTTYLDPHHQLMLMKHARDLADSGKSVVMVLHDIGLALRNADRIAVMEEGKLTASGTADDIWSSKVLDRVFKVKVQRADTATGWHYWTEET